MKKWLVIVDATQTYSGSRKLNEQCLERRYNKGTEEETVNYHCDVLEAKIVLGENLIISIAGEFIENNGEDAENQKKLSEEKRKQDCETKAFQRLSEKLKKVFSRLPIILLADSTQKATARPSVLSKLKAPAPAPRPASTALKKSAEREL